MISFVQTGNGIVDFILTLIFLVLITYLPNFRRIRLVYWSLML